MSVLSLPLSLIWYKSTCKEFGIAGRSGISRHRIGGASPADHGGARAVARRLRSMALPAHGWMLGRRGGFVPHRRRMILPHLKMDDLALQNHFPVPEDHSATPGNHSPVPQNHFQAPKNHALASENPFQAPADHPPVPEKRSATPETHSAAPENRPAVRPGPASSPASHAAAVRGRAASRHRHPTVPENRLPAPSP